MKYKTLRTVLETVDTSKLNESQAADIKEALAEIDWVASTSDISDTAYLISSAAAPEIVNLLTYDIFGRLARLFGGSQQVTADQFIKAVRVNYQDFCQFIPDNFFADGFCYLQDLWADNEDCGNNRADGSLRA